MIMDKSTDIKEVQSGSGVAVQEFVAQKLLSPDPTVNSEVDLFYHSDGHAGYNTQDGTFYCLKESSLLFDSFFNAFPVYSYDLGPEHKVKMRITIKGEGILRVYMARNEASWEQLIHSLFECKSLETIEFDLPLLKGDGLIYFQIYAKSDVTLVSGEYVIQGPVLNNASITGVITTFKRDAAVQATGKRLEKYFDENQDIASLFQLLVIDNGGDTDDIEYSRGRVIKNKNYGGAGGFSRGLLEAVSGGLSTHVLFMDDDATIFPESLRRTLGALRFSKDAKRAISGAMITEKHKWMMWENSALFDKRCIPLHCGADLRFFDKVMYCAFDNQGAQQNRYGGWWYFCFPVSEVENWTFPFFVRGDDIFFSLANDFHIRTLPGVVSMQEDFANKQSPLTIYLDLRNHLVQHLTFQPLRRSFWSDFTMLWRFFNRYNSSYHYESAEAINVAIEDVLKGPKFWSEDMDMSKKRAEIKALTKNEAILQNIDVGSIQLLQSGKGRLRKAHILRLLTLSGHLLPSLFFFAKGRCMPLNERAVPSQSFLRPVVVTMDSSDQSGYICSIDRSRYFRNLRRFLKNIWTYSKLRKDLVKDYESMQKETLNKKFWERVLFQD